MGGMGSIYYSAISQYADDHGIYGDTFDTFRWLLIVMDSEYLAVHYERAEQDRKSKKDT